MSDKSIKSSILPQRQGNTFSLTVGDIALFCTAANSGRITAFSYAGQNILTDAKVHPFNFGSTFWTAPQSDWGWPPPKAVDSEQDWQAAIEGDTIVLNGNPCAKLHVEITKCIRADATKEAFIITYSMKNIGDAPKAFAPWEISRVGPGGITFFPKGGASYPPVYQEPLVTQQIDGITWFAHSDDTVNGQHKLFADGLEGWIAHVDKGLLFLKTFDAQPAEKRAPGEAEIEIYAIREYVEIEQQGAYEILQPGDTRTWTVAWSLKRIPNSISVQPGGKSLVSFVRSVRQLDVGRDKRT